jgi:hypothetical protein
MGFNNRVLGDPNGLRYTRQPRCIIRVRGSFGTVPAGHLAAFRQDNLTSISAAASDKKRRPEGRRELDREEVELNREPVQYGRSRDDRDMHPFGLIVNLNNC